MPAPLLGLAIRQDLLLGLAFGQAPLLGLAFCEAPLLGLTAARCASAFFFSSA